MQTSIAENRTKEIAKSKVLIVDDIPENIMVIGNILYRAGLLVSYASDGIEALSIISHQKPDLILLDIQMPRMNGFELCSELKNSEEYKDIPIIFVTAHNDKGNINKGFHAGGVDYITKPVNSEELLHRVNTHLELKTKTDTLQQLNAILEEKVQQRTHDLQKANAQLALLGKAKTDFIALINHKIRTPLNSIIGFIELLKKNTLNNTKRERFISYIDTATKQLSNLCQDSLFISSLRAEQYKKQNNPILISRLIEDIKNCLSEQYAKKNIAFVVNIIPANLKIKNDYRLLYKSLYAVIDNAMKFSPSEGMVYIMAYQENNMMVYEISDEGNGFSEKALKNLFALFEQTGFEANGFGLGLAVTKLIIDTLKGAIHISNKKDENGAIVKIKIPVS